MTFLDTNVLIRYITWDDPHKAAQSEKLLEEARAGKSVLFLTHLAIAEVIWILSAQYQVPKSKTIDHLRKVLNTRNIVCDDLPLLLATLDLFEAENLSFIDAYHATFLPARDITTFYSYDTDFDQVAGITRKEP